MTSGTESVTRWLAPPAPAARLAALRVVVMGAALGYLLVRLPAFLDLRGRPQGSFEPVGVLSGLDRPLAGWVIVMFIALAVLAGLAAVAGMAYRATGPAFAGSMLVLTTYHSSFGQLLWFENLMMLHLLIIGLAPAADAWSIDSRHRPSDTSDARYGWPIRLAALVTIATYVLAGVAKLRYGGVPWVAGDTLRNHVAFSAARLHLLGGSPSPLAGSAVSQAWVFPPLAFATVVIELGAPMALLGGRWRTLWVASVWAMHVGILALMFVVFHWPLLGAAFAPLFALERPVQRLLARRRATARSA